jgi:hypothetical protein
MTEDRKKMYRGIAIAVVAFAILNILGFLLHPANRPPTEAQDDSFAGEVISISSDELTVVNARGVERQYRFAPDVRVFAGRIKEDLSDVHLGDRVLLEVRDGYITEIRFITTTLLQRIHPPQ